MKNFDTFMQCTLLWIENMLLCDEIRIKDFPQLLRIEMPTLYISTFRISRNISISRYVSDMKILYKDIICSKSLKHEELLKRMNDALDWLEFNSEKDFHAFKKDMDKKILQEVYHSRKTYADNIKHKLRKQGITTSN